jgi:hypothetical protein
MLMNGTWSLLAYAMTRRESGYRARLCGELVSASFSPPAPHVAGKQYGIAVYPACSGLEASVWGIMLEVGHMLAALRGRHHPSVPKPADLGLMPASTFKRMLNPSEEVSRRRFVTQKASRSLRRGPVEGEPCHIVPDHRGVQTPSAQ